MSACGSIRDLVDQLNETYATIYLGGGKSKIQKQHDKGKLTARERVDYLIDKDSTFCEIGTFAGHDMYTDHGGCPAGGVVAGMGQVSGQHCVIVANDATVKAGAWFPITAKKNLRAQEIAMENNIPIIYLVDSAGIYLPLQSEVFADKEHFGRVFRNNAKMSAMGITQIAAVMGSCVAGGAYLPIMSDEALIVQETGTIFLAGSYLVKAAIGESIDNQELGGAKMHSEVSGVVDYTFKDDSSCLNEIKKIIGKIAEPAKAGFNRVKSVRPTKDAKEIYDILPADRTKPYDTLEIIHRLVDSSEFDEYKKDYGKTILCGYARIDGWAVGIVANQRLISKTGKGEMQMGGVIYSDSADKAARFIMACNQKKIPLVFIQDVSGFMIGSRSEQGGIIKDGAKMVSAMANSTVPKFTIVTGNSYGAGNYAMCGKAYDPRLMLAWPTANIAVMSGSAAANTLLQIQLASQKSSDLSDEENEAALQKIRDRYEETTSPYYAAARLWVDQIIDPLETRDYISRGIEIANHKPVDKFNPGLLQT